MELKAVIPKVMDMEAMIVIDIEGMNLLQKVEYFGEINGLIINFILFL